MPPREDPPRITEEDREVMEHPEEGFDPEEIQRELDHQVEVVEHDNEWIDPEERVGGEDWPRRRRSPASVAQNPSRR